MIYTPILATLGYVLSPDGRQVLLVHRNKRPGDAHFGKYNGLGGKLQAGEDVVACMRREIKEEADLECGQMLLRGTISWPGFGKQGEDWFGFIFRIDTWTGTPRRDNPEGDLLWIDVERVPDLPLWEGDRHFLPLVFERTHRQFHGVMPYRDGKPVSWSCNWLDLSPSPATAAGEPVSADDPARKLVREARRLIAQGKFRETIDHLDIHRPAEWAVVDAQGANVLRWLGQAFVRGGQWLEARECLEQLRGVQKQEPLLPPLQYAAALTDLLRCYQHLGLDDGVAKVLEETRQLLDGRGR